MKGVDKPAGAQSITIKKTYPKSDFYIHMVKIQKLILGDDYLD